MKTFNVVIGMMMISLITEAQFYSRTGKNVGVYFTGVPLSSIGMKSIDPSMNTLSGGVGLMTMIKPGITISGGYGYTRFQGLSSQRVLLPNSSAHSAVGAILFDKRVARLQQKKVRGMCHYLSLGLILGADYCYMFGTRDMPNTSFGEIGGQVGVSFCHVYSGAGKRTQGQTNHFDIFFRQGFTPILNTLINGQTQAFYRCELGFRVRLLRHQVYDFLK